MAEQKLIVGLGNPGKKYQKNRHNLGFMAINLLAKHLEANWQDLPRFNAWLAKAEIGEEKVILVKPQTFMNKSGEAVSKVVNYYKIYPNDIWVIYDDVDLPLAELRIRPEGSAGGHQGMASVIKQMGTEKINRVKIGIGDNRQAGMSSEDYVLQNFSAAEKKEIDKTLADLLQRIAEILQ